MKKRILLAVSTLALALFGMGCLLQPLTPEEEAALRAEAEQYEAMDGEGTFDDLDDGFGESDPSLADNELGQNDIDPSDLETADEKPDPTPWVSSGSDNKPDPTPWRPMSGTVKPDPTPWQPVSLKQSDGNSTDVLMVGDDDKKPDPTPWRTTVR